MPRELSRARMMMVLMGLVTLGVHSWLTWKLAPTIRKMREMVANGRDDLAQDLRFIYFGLVFAFVSGLAFIILGLLIRKFPIGAPLAGLIIFVFGIPVNSLAPTPYLTIPNIIIMLLFLVTFAFVIQAGVEYRRAGFFGGHR